LKKSELSKPQSKVLLNALWGGLVDLSYPNSKTRRGRVQEGGTICPTITAQNTGICLIEKAGYSHKST
jgi:hypothetical protein